MLFTPGKTDITPAGAGYNEKRIDALHRHFERLMNEKKIQGASYCVSRKGRIFMSGAVGRLKYNDYKKPMLPDTPVRVASVTKLFTTVALMKLVEDGLLRLDTPVQDILPEFKKDNFWKITVYHLLTHTSGMIPDDGYPDSEERNYWKSIDEYISGYNPESDSPFNWIDAALKAGMRREPDEEWMYCSFGFVILGEIISRVSGINVHKYIKNEVFRPLGMINSVMDLTPEIAKRSLVRDEKHEKYLNDVINGVKTEDETEKYWDMIPKTGGGATSTPYDLIRFGNMCLNMGRLGDNVILGRKTFERITTRALYNMPNYAWNVNDPDRAYGIGFDMKTNAEYIYSPGSFFHEGAGACALIMDPAEEMAAAYFVPFDKGANGWSPEAVYNTQIIIWSGIL